MAPIDKVAKENKDIKYLLLAVDCLSRYLRVETLKSKYALTKPDAFKKILKNKRSKKVWVDAGTKFKGSFTTLCRKNEIEVHKTLSRQYSQLRKEYKIAQVFDIKIPKGQMEILVY